MSQTFEEPVPKYRVVQVDSVLFLFLTSKRSWLDSEICLVMSKLAFVVYRNL